MAAAQFDLLFRGEIETGYDIDDVKQTLASVFDLDDEELEEYFCGRSVPLRENMDATTANTFKLALASAGALTYLQAADAQSPGQETVNRRKAPRRVNAKRRSSVRDSAILPDRRDGTQRRSKT